MRKSSIIYQANVDVLAKYYHPQSDDYLEYKAKIEIKDSGKQPVVMKMNFDGIFPSFAPMPPEEHTIKAKDLIELFVKLKRWLKSLDSEDFGKYKM